MNMNIPKNAMLNACLPAANRPKLNAAPSLYMHRPLLDPFPFPPFHAYTNIHNFIKIHPSIEPFEPFGPLYSTPLLS